jgi:enoyl-CoA hydratase/carnithine racemase
MREPEAKRTMAYGDYQCLRVKVESGVAWVTIDHPPVNLFDFALIQDVTRVGMELEADADVRVVVFQSADPEFFIAHADVGLIMGLPAEPPQKGQLGLFHAMVDRFRTMPKVTIGKLEGRARGGGSELLLGLDMRFASLEKAVLAQPEVSVGIIPGGGGTQRLPRLIGRARALEVVLGCLDYPAALAEKYGYVNRALPQAELGPFVEKLALRIASYPAEAIALAKQAVCLADAGLVEGQIEEERLFLRSAANAEARERMARFLEAGGQTREAELSLGEVMGSLG